MANSQNVYGNTRLILLQVFLAITLKNKHRLIHTKLCVRLTCVSVKKQSPLCFSVITVNKNQLPALDLNNLRLFQVMI